MNNLNELKKFNINSVLPIICGVTLLKISKTNNHDLNSKENFFLLIKKAISSLDFKPLIELEKWISLNTTSLNENVFFSIYNIVIKHSSLQLMDYFNKSFDVSRIKQNRMYNNSLTKLATSIIDLNNNDTFLDPTATLNGAWLKILKNNPHQKMFLQTIQPLEACWIYLNAKALNADNIEITSKNVLTEPKYIINNELKQFDRIITIPPFGIKIPTELISNSYNRFKFGDITSINTEWGFVSNVISSLNNTGKATILLPNGPLFITGKRKEIRDNIIKSDKIEAIISFPEKFFFNTSISTNLLLLNNEKNKLNNKIIFIDANQPDWIRHDKIINNLTLEGIQQISQLLKNPKNITNISQIIDISSHPDTLMVNKFVPKDHVVINDQKYRVNLSELKKIHTIPLKEVAHIQPGYNMVHNKKTSDSFFKILKISDINENKSIDYANLSSVESDEKSRLNKYIIKKNDIIFSVRGSLGKTTFIEKKPPLKTIISSNLIIIRCYDNKVVPKWLYLYLKSLLVKYFIKKNESGALISTLPLKSLKEIPILLNSLDRQNETVGIYNQNIQNILKLQQKIEMDKKMLLSQLNKEFTINKIFKEL